MVTFRADESFANCQSIAGTVDNFETAEAIFAEHAIAGIIWRVAYSKHSASMNGDVVGCQVSIVVHVDLRAIVAWTAVPMAYRVQFMTAGRGKFSATAELVVKIASTCKRQDGYTPCPGFGTARIGGVRWRPSGGKRVVSIVIVLQTQANLPQVVGTLIGLT